MLKKHRIDETVVVPIYLPEKNGTPRIDMTDMKDMGIIDNRQ